MHATVSVNNHFLLQPQKLSPLESFAVYSILNGGAKIYGSRKSGLDEVKIFYKMLRFLKTVIIQQNIQGGKLSQFFIQLQIFSDELWPC